MILSISIIFIIAFNRQLLAIELGCIIIYDKQVKMFESDICHSMNRWSFEITSSVRSFNLEKNPYHLNTHAVRALLKMGYKDQKEYFRPQGKS